VECTSAFLDVSTELLAREYRVRFLAEGWSMHPTIRDKELITVAAVHASEIGPGDILLYRTDHKVLAHRVVRITRVEGVIRLTLRGDGTDLCDAPIGAQQVLGRVVAVDREGRRIDLDGRGARMRWKLGRWWKVGRKTLRKEGGREKEDIAGLQG